MLPLRRQAPQPGLPVTLANSSASSVASFHNDSSLSMRHSCSPPSSLTVLLHLAVKLVSSWVIFVMLFLNDEPSATRPSTPKVRQPHPCAVELHRQALHLRHNPCQLVNQPINIVLLRACWPSSQHSSEVQNKMIFMGHEISSCHVPVVRSFFIYFKIISSS